MQPLIVLKYSKKNCEKWLTLTLIQVIIIKSLDTVVTSVSGCGGMADAQDSKSCGGDLVWVQVPPSAQKKRYLRQMSEVSFFVAASPLSPRSKVFASLRSAQDKRPHLTMVLKKSINAMFQVISELFLNQTCVKMLKVYFYLLKI